AGVALGERTADHLERAEAAVGVTDPHRERLRPTAGRGRARNGRACGLHVLGVHELERVAPEQRPVAEHPLQRGALVADGPVRPEDPDGVGAVLDDRAEAPPPPPPPAAPPPRPPRAGGPQPPHRPSPPQGAPAPRGAARHARAWPRSAP